MRFFGLLLPLLLLAGPAGAEPVSGEALHAKHCVGCHQRITQGNGSVLYTRENRRVNSLQGLARQVKRCKNNLQITLFDEDVAAIVRYLNDRYYHFEE